MAGSSHRTSNNMKESERERERNNGVWNALVAVPSNLMEFSCGFFMVCITRLPRTVDILLNVNSNWHLICVYFFVD